MQKREFEKRLQWVRRCSEHKRRGKQKNLVHSSPKRQLNFATASEAASEGELFFPSNLHNTAAGTLGMCFFIELICEEFPLESSSNALTGNDTLSLAVSNSGEATRSPCIFRPSKAFFLLVPQASASGSHSLPLSIIGIARNGRGKTFTPPSAFYSSHPTRAARKAPSCSEAAKAAKAPRSDVDLSEGLYYGRAHPGELGGQ